MLKSRNNKNTYQTLVFLYQGWLPLLKMIKIHTLQLILVLLLSEKSENLANFSRSLFYVSHHIMKKKSHTCEDGEAHLRISFRHLLMNLKNKYLLKNGCSGPIKNKIILIFTMLHFFKKSRKTPGNIVTSHLCTKNLDDMIYSS